MFYLIFNPQYFRYGDLKKVLFIVIILAFVPFLIPVVPTTIAITKAPLSWLIVLVKLALIVILFAYLVLTTINVTAYAINAAIISTFDGINHELY